tara:strand:+ start:3184 stop:3576 length:393 start_codon:yes stop_codon:yes gene_type:complete
MLWVKAAWACVVECSSKSWEAIKKLPGWAVVVALFLFALLFWLLKINALQRRRAEVQENLRKIELDYNEARVEATDDYDETVDDLREARALAKGELNQIEDQIDEANEKGAVAVANEWKEYLFNKGGKDE